MSAIDAGTMMMTYCVRATAPTPSTLPPSSSTGDAAPRMISMTRLLFSSTTLIATHVP